MLSPLHAAAASSGAGVGGSAQHHNMPRSLLWRSTAAGLRVLPAQVSTPRAYLPHHRQHTTREHPTVLRHRRARAAQQQQEQPPSPQPPQQQPADAVAAAEAADVDVDLLPGMVELRSIAAWLESGAWRRDALASLDRSAELQAAVQAHMRELAQLLAATYQQAAGAWQQVVACWPAWRASLQDDAELLLEYALGLIPAWLAMARESLARAAQQAAALPQMQQAADAAARATRDAQALRAAVQEQMTATARRLAAAAAELQPPPAPPAAAPAGAPVAAPAAGKRAAAGARASSSSSKGGRIEIAEVAYSLFWFGGSGVGSSKKSAQADAVAAASAIPPAQHALQTLQANMAAQADALLLRTTQPAEGRGNRRWRAPQRKGWVDRVVSRAAQRGMTPPGHAQRAGGPWRHLHRQAQQIITLPAEALASAGRGAQQGLVSAQRGAQQAAAAAVAGSQAGAQACRSVLVTPLQRLQVAAKAPQAPAVVAAAAAASLLAAAVVRGLQQQRQAVSAQELQEVSAQNAEALRQQKARIMGALQQSQVADARATTVDAAGAAGAAQLDAEADEAEEELPDAGAAAAAPAAPPELDPAAAALWQQFLSGARATGVPMWDQRSLEQAPRVSRREAERQTQKIRAAAAPEDAAALQAADMQVLDDQLQALTEAPMGRAARAAWLKQQQEGQQAAAGGAVLAAAGGDGAAGAAPKKRPGSADNPFAISAEVRAQWSAEDSEEQAAGRQQAKAAQPSLPTPPAVVAAAAPPVPATGSPAPDGSRPGSRGGSRRASKRAGSSSGGGGGGNSNPFAISGDVRKQWEAEDGAFTDATPRPLQPEGGSPGGLLGGLFGLLRGGSSSSDNSSSRPAAAAPPTRQQQQRRRAPRPAQAPAAAAAAGPAPSGPAERLPRSFEVPVPLPAELSAGSQPAPPVQKRAKVAKAGGAPAAGGAAAPEEGSPEWLALRAELQKSGVARRARLQQQAPPAPAAAPAAATAAVGGAGQQLVAQEQQPQPQEKQRKDWRRRMLSEEEAPAAAKQAAATASSSASTSLVAAVSKADAQDVTAEPPTSWAAPADAAAAPAEGEADDARNPFAVDAAIALSDDDAFELGQEYDRDAAGIKLRL